MDRLVTRGKALAHQRATQEKSSGTPTRHEPVELEQTVRAGAAAIDGNNTVGEAAGHERQLVTMEMSRTLDTSAVKPIRLVVTAIRSTVRKLSARNRLTKRQNDLALKRWVDTRTAALQHHVLRRSAKVNGVKVQPGPPNMTTVEWALPSAQVSKSILKAAGAPRVTCFKDAITHEEVSFSVHKRLRDKWTERHGVFRDRDKERLGALPPTRYTAALGRKLGMCACGKHILLLFRGAFVNLLRGYFRKSDSNASKRLFEANACVLCLNWTAVDKEGDGAEDTVDMLQRRHPILKTYFAPISKSQHCCFCFEHQCVVTKMKKLYMRKRLGHIIFNVGTHWKLASY